MPRNDVEKFINLKEDRLPANSGDNSAKTIVKTTLQEQTKQRKTIDNLIETQSRETSTNIENIKTEKDANDSKKYKDVEEEEGEKVNDTILNNNTNETITTYATLYPIVIDITQDINKVVPSEQNCKHHKRKTTLSKNRTTTENFRILSLRARISTARVSVLSNSEQNQDEKNAEEKQQQLNNYDITQDKSVKNQFDVALLNKIETLECEIPINKRKRRNRTANTRKRDLAQKTVKDIDSKRNEHIESIEEIQQQEVKKEEVKYAAPGESNLKKRQRIMSLYERRYPQTEEGGGRSVVTNGYISSTRTSSATSSSNAVHSDTVSTDTQDISSNQYYMPPTTAPLSGNNSSVTSLGNGSAINHAPSMATLCNIGNTCYLNSVVYTLRFAPRFLHNLHHLIVDLSTIQHNIVRQRAKSSSLGRGMSAVQMENARSWSSKDLVALEQQQAAISSITGGGVGNNEGNYAQKASHQLLTERLHELYQSLHRNEVSESTEPFHADTLLHAIQDVSAIFEGNQQQDAHEFLMCVLNGIRETCQTLIKAISEYPDVIINGYIKNADETDAATNSVLQRDNIIVNSQAASNGGGSSSSFSSLSTSNISKASFFSRKSKRKEEAKNSKNSRVQSPLKEGGGGGGLQPHSTSNSLFYLNTVDLSGASGVSQSNQSASTGALVKSIGSAGDMDASSSASSPIVSLLKDKKRLAEKIRELGLDFFSEDFEGVTVSTTKCLSCETITEQKESMIDIAVPVPISGYESSDYMEKPSAFIQNSCITREYFRGENKYRCEQCIGYTEAIRSISYEVLPRLLVIQLSRFSGGMEKINSYIPTSFTLQCFCSKCCDLSDSNKLHIYKLYSVITHVGATMSVGHYIAYTCSLDWANEYLNCPKDRRTSESQQQQQQSSGISNNNLNGLQQNNGNVVLSTSTQSSSSAAGVAASVLASSGTSLMKKMKFGRSKASSSGDMSKNVKNLNGITSKTITNGIGKLSMNTTCHSLNCCATRLCSAQQLQQPQHLNTSDLSEEGLHNGSSHYQHSANSTSSSSTNTINCTSYPAGYGSTGRGGSKTTYNSSSSGTSNITVVAPTAVDPIWYMCDDDKIKAMTQREFEELLSPARKITVTPYLLFYARFDLQSKQTPVNTTGMVSAGSLSLAQSQTSSSWSNESFQSHKI